MLGVFILERDTGVSVVHLFTAEALVARHERRTGQSATGTVVGAGVIVVGHSVTLSCSCECVLYHAAAVVVKRRLEERRG
tara:strand:+ start:2638 stop:2877 length:240 start_codon:yes stop_codon:yes gene_type:complete